MFKEQHVVLEHVEFAEITVYRCLEGYPPRKHIISLCKTTEERGNRLLGQYCYISNYIEKNDIHVPGYTHYLYEPVRNFLNSFKNTPKNYDLYVSQYPESCYLLKQVDTDKIYSEFAKNFDHFFDLLEEKLPSILYLVERHKKYSTRGWLDIFDSQKVKVLKQNSESLSLQIGNKCRDLLTFILPIARISLETYYDSVKFGFKNHIPLYTEWGYRFDFPEFLFMEEPNNIAYIPEIEELHEDKRFTLKDRICMTQEDYV